MISPASGRKARRSLVSLVAAYWLVLSNLLYYAQHASGIARKLSLWF